MFQAAVTLRPAPHDQGKLRPNGGVGVRAHHYLYTIIAHVPYKVRVNLNHTLRKPLATAHCQNALTVGVPFGERLFQQPVVPNKKKLRKFVIIHCVNVRLVSEPYVGGMS